MNDDRDTDCNPFLVMAIHLSSFSLLKTCSHYCNRIITSSFFSSSTSKYQLSTRKRNLSFNPYIASKDFSNKREKKPLIFRCLSSKSDNMPEVNPKPEVLVLGKQHPKLVSDLKSFCNLHELESIVDQESFFKMYGPRIRGVATNNFTGFSTDLFEKLPAIEIIGSFGVGVDSIDVAGAKSRGIQVTNTPDVLTDDVADLAIALMLSVSRQICESDRYVKSGLWKTNGFMPLTKKVSGKRVGIVGLGRIGLAIAKRAESFNCSISYYGRSPKPEIPYLYFNDLVAMAQASDFLIIACPLSPSTTHIINREVIEGLGSKGVLVNIARGPVVDEKEMVLALVQGRLGGAGLDVFENEPEVPEELMKLENVVLLPHVASATVETRQDMADLTVQNIRAYFEGKPLPTPV